MSRGANRQEQDDRRGRIIARLFALADLAEQASLRISLLRILMLWLFRPVAQVMECYVGDLALDAGLLEWPVEFDLPVYDPDDGGPDDSAAELIDIALKFRVFAGTLAFLAAYDLWPDDESSLPYWRHAFGLENPRGFQLQLTGEIIRLTLLRPEVRRVVLPGYS